MLKGACAALGLLLALVAGALLLAGGLAEAADRVGLQPDVLPLAAHSPHHLTVKVSERGFNGSRQGVALKVEKGQPIEITFLYEDMAMEEDNPHRIYVDELKLMSPTLSRENPEVTIRITPDQTGTITFRCALRCEGHRNLQAGTLEVYDPTLPPPAPVTLSARTLLVSEENGEMTVQATALDSAGQPLQGIPVRFYVTGELVIADRIAIGEAQTNANGEATVTYWPTAPGPVRFIAEFPGTPRLERSEATLIAEATVARPAYRPEPANLPVPGRWGVRGIVIVALTVWSIYAFVGYQIFRIFLAGRSRVVREERSAAARLPTGSGR